MNASPVWCGLDLDADGKDADFLRIPHSTDTSAYGLIPIPIVRIKSGSGPTILLCAGNHGDEYEGQIALRRLAREIEASAVSGRIIILPALNYPAVAAGRRVSPIDEGNLNRVFPGQRNGSPTAMLAHYLVSEVLPRCDVIIDLHSGGRSLNYVHCGLGHYDKSPQTDAAIRSLLEVFGAPWSVFTKGGGGGGSTTLYATAADMGIPAITTELGGGAVLDPKGLHHAESGTRRVLAHYGVWRGAAVPAHAQTRFARTLPSTKSIYSHRSGLFEPLVEVGDVVSAGQLGGLLHSIDHPLRAPRELRFIEDGMVVCRRSPVHTAIGDCLLKLAQIL